MFDTKEREYLNEIYSIIESKDDEFEFSFSNNYTDDDDKIFGSENYCLNHILAISSGMNKKFKYECKDGALLKSSKEVGIECGELSIILKGGSIDAKIKTCLPIVYDMFSKMVIPEFLREDLHQSINSISKFDSSFNLELSDSKGRKIIYDSETGKIIANKSSILTVYKYLFLLRLFLF